jgi:hypothetical protein
VSHSEDLTNKLTEVRSTIKFQLKKVLCLGVAVGHVDMNDDQVLGNVMLSMHLPQLFKSGPVSNLQFRHQFPRLPSQKELAERQVSPHQEYHGQAHPPLLDFIYHHYHHLINEWLLPELLRVLG